ncbi:hypothetical protein [Variovorax sp.]|jgi:uncharacterized protein
MYTNIKTGNRSAVVAGISGRAKELRTTFASREDALAAARAEWLRIQPGIFAFEVTLAYGRADLTPQRPVRVAGYKPQIDATPWIITCVRHTLDGGGYVSQLTLETEQAEGSRDTTVQPARNDWHRYADLMSSFASHDATCTRLS